MCHTRNHVQESLNAMQTALRVLSALTEKRLPAESDVVALQKYANDGEGEALDELACDVIRRAIERREAVRKALLTGSGHGL